MKIDLDQNTYLEISRIKSEVVLSIKSRKDNKTSIITLKLKKDDVSSLVSKLIVLRSEQDLYETK